MTRRQDDITQIRRIIPAALPPADLPAQAPDAPGSLGPAGGILFHAGPTQAQLVIARELLRRNDTPEAAIERACATLNDSPDEADRKLAAEARAAVWLRKAAAETRALTDDEIADAMSTDDVAWDCAPAPAFDEIPDVWGAAVKIIAIIGAALAVAALVWWFAVSAAAAVEWARTVQPMGGW